VLPVEHGMTATTPIESPDERAPAVEGPRSTPPFFIVGAQRSGTTLFRLMLDGSPARVRLSGGEVRDARPHAESTLRRVCEFLDVAFHPGMLEYHASAEGEMPAEARHWHRNSIRPPDQSLIDEWRRRMSRADRIIFEQVAGDALELFGYERERLPATVASRFKNLYYAVWRRW